MVVMPYGRRGAQPVTYPFGFVTRQVMAGSYYSADPTYFGVCLAAEIKLPADVRVAIRDFGTPSYDDMTAAVDKVMWVMAKKKPVYVGCMGGLGRTGTFLAVLAKVLVDDPDPVRWVREAYDKHAVETKGQEKFVADIDVSDLQLAARRARLVAPLYFWRR